MKSIASKGRPEGFQRAIGKPFGRARRREISALGKAILLSENSIKRKAMIFIPPFIPEMNPMEQTWKEIRKRGFKTRISTYWEI